MKARWIGLGIVSALALGCGSDGGSKTPNDGSGMPDDGATPDDGADGLADGEIPDDGADGTVDGDDGTDEPADGDGDDGSQVAIMEASIENVCRDSPRWSPSGRIVVYQTCAGDETDGVYLRDLSKSSPIELTDADRNSRQFVFTSDERRVVYLMGGPDGTVLRAVDIDGKNPVDLTEPDISAIQALTMTAEDRVLWVSNRARLLSVPAAGGAIAAIADLSGTELLFRQFDPFTPTPDGGHVLFQTDGKGSPVMIAPTNGSSDAVQLGTFTKPIPFWNTVSNDSLLLSHGDNFELAHVSLDDGSATKLADNIPQLTAYANGHAFWATNTGRDVWHWKVGDALPTEPLATATSSFSLSPDGTWVLWYDFTNQKVMSQPSDGSAEPIAIMDIDDGVHLLSLSPDATHIAVIDGESLKLAEITTAGSGTVIEADGVSRTDPIGWNGTSTHAFYFKDSSGSGFDTSDTLWAVEVASGNAAAFAEDVYAWTMIPNVASVAFTTGVEEITDVLATLHIEAP